MELDKRGQCNYLQSNKVHDNSDRKVVGLEQAMDRYTHEVLHLDTSTRQEVCSLLRGGCSILRGVGVVYWGVAGDILRGGPIVYWEVVYSSILRGGSMVYWWVIVVYRLPQFVVSIWASRGTWGVIEVTPPEIKPHTHLWTGNKSQITVALYRSWLSRS